MNITKDNFYQELPRLAELIQTATYMSVDFEMTGLFLLQDKQQQIDTVEERYTKMRNGIQDGLRTLQFGLTLSHFNKETNEIVHTPYNIYTWPTCANLLDPTSPMPQPQVLLDVDSIEFNRSHGMDFNQWIRGGVSYLPRLINSKLDVQLNDVMKVEESYLNNDDIQEHKNVLGKVANAKPRNELERQVLNRYANSCMAWITQELYENKLISKKDFDEFVQQTSRSAKRKKYSKGGKKEDNDTQAVAVNNDNNNNNNDDDVEEGEKEEGDKQEQGEEQDGEQQQKQDEELIDPSTASFIITQNFDCNEDKSWSREVVNVQTELTLWRFCRKYDLIVRVEKYYNQEAKNKGITVKLYTKDKYKEYLAEKRAILEENKIKMYGISYVWQLMTNSLESKNLPETFIKEDGNKLTLTNDFGAKSPLIVHNGYFDLMFLFHHCEGDLPLTFAEMATKLHQFFPNGIYDTKFLFGHPTTQILHGYRQTKGVSQSLGGLYTWFNDEQGRQIQKKSTKQNDQAEQDVSLDTNELQLDTNVDSILSPTDTDGIVSPTVQADDNDVVAKSVTGEESIVEITSPTGTGDASPSPAKSLKSPRGKWGKRNNKNKKDDDENKELTPAQLPFPELYITHTSRPGFDAYVSDEDRCHEAGYDSWITAVLFGHLLVFISSDSMFQCRLKNQNGEDVPIPSGDNVDSNSNDNNQAEDESAKIDDVINRMLALPFFQDVYMYRCNSFGQYIAFDWSYVRSVDNNFNKTNYFCPTSNKYTPPALRADYFVLTFKIDQLYQRLIKDRLLIPKQDANGDSNLSVPYYDVINMNEISKAIVSHLITMLADTDSPTTDNPWSQPYVELFKHNHLTVNNKGEIIALLKLTPGTSLLKYLPSIDQPDEPNTYKQGNIIGKYSFIDMLLTALGKVDDNIAKIKQMNEKKNENDNNNNNNNNNKKQERIPRPVYLAHITPDDIDVQTFDEYLTYRDAAHLYAIGEAYNPVFCDENGRNDTHYPFALLDQNKQKNLIALQNKSDGSSTIGSMTKFAIGALGGLLGAVLVIGANYFTRSDAPTKLNRSQ